MPAVLNYPNKVIFNQSGTYTSDQNVTGIDASGVHSLIWGVSASGIIGGSGNGIVVSIGFLAPDGHYYEMDRQTGISGEQWFPIDIPVVPETINIGWGLNGATSVEMSIWMLGQA